MKYYIVIFSDYSETVGKQTSRAAMERDARQYCKMWGLSETVKEVQEITAEEYSRRTGKPTEEPPAERPAKKKSNRIPRNARRIFVTWLIDTTGNKAGDAATVEKDDPDRGNRTRLYSAMQKPPQTMDGLQQPRHPCRVRDDQRESRSPQNLRR